MRHVFNTKSIGQIGYLWFFETNSGSVYELLLWKVCFVLGTGRGIEVLAEPIFVRGFAPSMEAALPPPSMAGMPHARAAESKKPGNSNGNFHVPPQRARMLSLIASAARARSSSVCAALIKQISYALGAK